MLVVKLWFSLWHFIQVKLEFAGGGRELQQTGLSRAAEVKIYYYLSLEKHYFMGKKYLYSFLLLPNSAHFRKNYLIRLWIKWVIPVITGTFCVQNKLFYCFLFQNERIIKTRFILSDCFFKFSVANIQCGNLADFENWEGLRHQTGLCYFAGDRNKPRDIISFLTEPAKLVPHFALGKEGLCGAARWPPEMNETTIIQMIRQKSCFEGQKKKH